MSKPWNFGSNDAFGFAIFNEANKSGNGSGSHPGPGGNGTGCGIILLGAIIVVVPLVLLISAGLSKVSAFLILVGLFFSVYVIWKKSGHKKLRDSKRRKTMILKEIIDSVEFDAVWEVVQKEYPKQKEEKDSFAEMFSKLKVIEPVRKSENILDIEYRKDNDANEWYWDVCSVEPNSGKRYALDFLPWAEFIAFTLSEKILETLSKESIVAHCMWEMSFYGYNEEEIQAKSEADEDMEGTVSLEDI